MHWLLWIVLLLSVFPAMGQREMTASDRLRPQWMHKLPVPSNLSFVYVVEKADGRTLEEAREACLLRLADNRQLMNTVHATAERDMEEEVRQRCRFQYHFFGHYHGDLVIRQKYVLLYEQILRLK